MEESAIFDAVVDIVVGAEFDYYIYDLVPLGHALYYLTHRPASTTNGLAKSPHCARRWRNTHKWRPCWSASRSRRRSQILAELQDIKERINTSSSILTDREKTAFFFVITPEEMIILDTLKAAKLFAKYEVPISGYIVNRVIPPELAQQDIPEYLRNRIEMQEKYIGRIGETFGDEVLASVQEFERDITGLEMIGKVADALFGGEA